MPNTRHAGEGKKSKAHKHGPDNPAVEGNMSRDVFNLPQNVILDGIKDYSNQDQEDLLWLAGYCRDALNNSRGALCELLDCDYTTIWRVMTGSYPAKITNFMAGVRNARRKASRPGAGFVETIVTRKIFSVLDLARDQNAIVHISGSSRRSKTTAVREWQRRNNHGRSIYLDVPVIGAARALLEAVAAKAGVGSGGRKTNDLAKRLESAFDWRHTIILDEAVRLLPKGGRSAADFTGLEFLRRLHDVSGVGLVFVSTDIFRQEMESGKYSGYLEQLLGRIEESLYIPARVSRQEAGDICRAFNRDADADLIRLSTKIANEKGKLGILFRLLGQAAKLAEAKGEPLNANHLATAKALRENLFRWPEE